VRLPEQVRAVYEQRPLEELRQNEEGNITPLMAFRLGISFGAGCIGYRLAEKVLDSPVDCAIAAGVSATIGAGLITWATGGFRRRDREDNQEDNQNQN